MDNRCPRHLTDFPDSWCAQAVLRLRAIRNAGRELTEEEEALLPGCPWAISSQGANYCFFAYLQTELPEKTLSDIEVAGLLNISIETVRKTEKGALAKMRADAAISEWDSSSSV